MEKNSKQKEEFARQLAEKEEKANKIIARAYYFDFNAPQAGYYRVKTKVTSK